MLSSGTLVFRYSAFAALATLINIATQFVSTILYAGRYELYVAMAAGTLAGLIAKYILDRRWIFYDQPTDVRGHSRKFSLYSLMGVFTTLIFWGTEMLFDALGDGPYMRYVGAVIGLAIGYVTKYHLDRRFVFGDANR